MFGRSGGCVLGGVEGVGGGVEGVCVGASPPTVH